RDLPHRDGTRDAPEPPPGGVDLIAARGGLRLVQRRVSALRRAVVAEVEDINRLIYHILRGGVVVSVAVLVFGFVLVAMTGRPLSDAWTRSSPRLVWSIFRRQESGRSATPASAASSARSDTATRTRLEGARFGPSHLSAPIRAGSARA